MCCGANEGVWLVGVRERARAARVGGREQAARWEPMWSTERVWRRRCGRGARRGRAGRACLVVEHQPSLDPFAPLLARPPNPATRRTAIDRAPECARPSCVAPARRTFLMAATDEPPRSLSSTMASWIMTANAGCSGALRGLVTFLATLGAAASALVAGERGVGGGGGRWGGAVVGRSDERCDVCCVLCCVCMYATLRGGAGVRMRIVGPPIGRAARFIGAARESEVGAAARAASGLQCCERVESSGERRNLPFLASNRCALFAN